MPRFQFSAYGFFISGFRNVTVWPLNVASPAEAPAGCWIPPGNGLLSVAAGVRLLLLVVTIEVVWLKPSCASMGLVE